MLRIFRTGSASRNALPYVGPQLYSHTWWSCQDIVIEALPGLETAMVKTEALTKLVCAALLPEGTKDSRRQWLAYRT